MTISLIKEDNGFSIGKIFDLFIIFVINSGVAVM